MDIRACFDGLDRLFAQGSYDQVEGYLTSCLAQAEAEGDFTSAISLCNELGGVYRVRTLYAKGEELFTKALGYLRQCQLEGTPGHGTTLLNYATLLTAAGRSGEAAGLFAQAAAVFEALGDGESYSVASLHNNISSLYLQQKEFDKALEHTQAALRLLAGKRDCEDEEGVTYTIRAQIFTQMRQLDEALSALEHAENAFRRCSDPSPVHQGAMYSAWGDTLYLQGRYNEAKARYHQALPLAEQSTGQSRSCATILRSLSYCCKAQGQDQEARELQERAAALDGAGGAR